jgi:hypothetical protein
MPLIWKAVVLKIETILSKYCRQAGGMIFERRYEAKGAPEVALELTPIATWAPPDATFLHIDIAPFVEHNSADSNRAEPASPAEVPVIPLEKRHVWNVGIVRPLVVGG